MSKITICDKCSNQIEYGFKIKISSKYFNVNNKTFHLCDDCFDVFMSEFTDKEVSGYGPEDE